MLLSEILPQHSLHARVDHHTQPDRLRQPVFHLENLLENYQRYHPHESLIAPKFRQYCIGALSAGEGLAYEFFGLSVGPSSAQFRRMQRNANCAESLRLSEVAALALDQEFGAENIAWNRQADSIEVKIREGFSLSLSGTNLVEAAIYLPRLYRSLLGRISSGLIPEGVASVMVQVEGETQESAIAASPLKIGLRLPNPATVVTRLNEEVETALDRVLGSRKPPSFPLAAKNSLQLPHPHCG